MRKRRAKSSTSLSQITLVSKICPVPLVKYGKVNLKELTDKDWRGELSNFLNLYGHICVHNFHDCVTNETKTHRRRILFTIIGRLIKGKHLQNLASVRPRHLPWLLEDWKSQGISESLQLNNYYHVRWFFKIHGISIPSIPPSFKTNLEYVNDFPRSEVQR